MPPVRRREELEGYLEGVRVRLAPPEIEERAALLAEWARARDALRAGRLAEAEALLRTIDGALDAQRLETVVVERPRGLTGYRTLGGAEVPPGPEEEALANRIRLIGRLATVRAAAGGDVVAVRGDLAKAQAAYARGDRAEARRLVDRAHGRLEALDPERRERSP